MRPLHKTPWLLSVMCLLAGALPIGIGLDVLPHDPARLHAPPWIVVMAGAVFWLAGVLLLIKDRPRLSDGLAAILLLMFSAIGAWVALRGEAGSFSGPWPMAPQGAGQVVARTVFGLGAVSTLVMAMFALRRMLAPDRSE